MISLKQAIEKFDGKPRANIPSENHFHDTNRLIGFRVNHEDFLHMVQPLDALGILLKAAKAYHELHGELPPEKPAEPA
jgi:hypothetical protein